MNARKTETRAQTLLAALAAARGPLKPDELFARLGVAEGEPRAPWQEELATLERNGQLVRNRAGLLLLPSRANLIAGQVQGHRDGFGFLIREDGGPDLVLSEHEMAKALHGDRVLARVEGQDRRGRPLGEIVEVAEHRTNKLVGRFLNERGVSIVVPEDQRIRHDILVPPAATAGAQHGQVVVVEIVQQPASYVQAMGRVLEVLGEIDDPGMEIEIAVRKFNVPHLFPDAVLEAAETLPDEVRARDLRGRIDLRDVPLVTIDGEDARDFDDAVYCEPIKGRKKAWRLIVAIADVSHYVKPGDAIDAEAQKRSTSVYFPRRVIPMLPEKLSNGLCSLNPEVDRLVLVCDCVVSAEGEVSAYQFYPAVIHSHARLTYNDVWEALSVPGSRAGERLAHVMPQLRDLHGLYETLVGARRTRGAIDFETTETYIICDPNGRIERIVPRVRNDAHRLIEECMLAANTCAADFLARHKQAGLYRVHEGPSPDRLETLRTLLKSVGLALEGGDTPEPGDYARLLKQIHARPDAQLLQTVLLRSMQQAVYSPHNAGHFGLAFAAYTHYTSPIRRYPDLLVHRAIKAVLAAKPYLPTLLARPDMALASRNARALNRVAAAAAAAAPEQAPRRGAKTATKETKDGGPLLVWEQLGLLCSANERRADEASRDVEAWLKSYFMRDRVGETFSGTVSSVVPFGLFVVLDDLFVEGLVHVSELGSEYFLYNEALHELRGERTGLRYRLGDRVHVQVARVDLEARRIEFKLVRPTDRKTLLAAPAEAAKSGKSAGKAARKKGESVDGRRTRSAVVAARKGATDTAAPAGKRAASGTSRTSRKRSR